MQSKVDPDTRNALIWNAFFDLTGDRPAGMGFVGRIPFTSVDAYARRYGINHIDDFERFQRLLRIMDDAFVAHTMEKLRTKDPPTA